MTRAPSTPTDRLGLYAAVAVAVLAFVAHASTLGAGFVYDDHRFIVQNEAIQSIDPVAFFSEASTTSASEGVTHDIYRPLRTLLFSIEYTVFGLSPGGWHLISVLLHVLNAVLVFFLIMRLLPGRAIAAGIGAGLFAVHPMTSESVAWVSSQGDLLALALMLLALRSFARTGTRATISGSVLFIAACFAKESALVLPALVFFQDLVLRKRGAADAPSWRESWLRMAVGALLIAIYFWIRVSVVPTIQQVPHPGGISGTVAGMFEGMAWYTSMLLVPRGFPFDLRYHVPLSFAEPMVVLGMSIMLVILLAGFYGLRTRRYVLAFCALGFLACLVPVSNVIVPLKTFIADRFLYPGLVCIALGVALLAGALLRRWRRVVPYVAGAAIVVLAVLSLDRGRSWADEMTLWKAVRADRPTNANAYQGIAHELARKAEIADAERAFRTYIAFNPIDGKAWVQLGDLFKRAALSLDASVEGVEKTNIVLRRRQARAAQITAYREAQRIWNAFGLEMGRGSVAMQNQMFGDWFAAAAEIADVGEMKRVNDLELVARHRIDPTDFDEFWKRAPWRFRARRFAIVTTVFQARLTEREIPEEQRQMMLQQRALVLSDVGLDPGLARERHGPKFRRLIERETLAAAARGEAVSVPDFEVAALMLIGIKDMKGALRILNAGLSRHPNNTLLLSLQSRIPR